MASDSYDTFEDVKSRLDEIVDAVSDDNLPLDDALALYEEAVALGLRASDLLEVDIDAQRAEEETDAAEDAAGMDADSAAEGTAPMDVDGAAGNAAAANTGGVFDEGEAAHVEAASCDVLSGGRPAEVGFDTAQQVGEPTSA